MEIEVASLAKNNNHKHSPAARYSLLSEKIRQSASGDLQCSVFCGGKKCRYETPGSWSPGDQAVPGVYSHWVTEDILAMARPNTPAMESHSLLAHFRTAGIRSIINLQTPGEHACCGPAPLHEDSGFSYLPQVFMDAGVYFYNFLWKDYGSVSEALLLDMVKVMAFALTEGKVAVHCHAGLGRTGVLIACYLVYALRCKPNDAIRYVRVKRNHSIQTRNQIQCVQTFAQYVNPLFVVFTSVIPKMPSLTLSHHLFRQRMLLHGLEIRHLKYIPKLVYLICERLLDLAEPSYSQPSLCSAINYKLSSQVPLTRLFVSGSTKLTVGSPLSPTPPASCRSISPSQTVLDHLQQAHDPAHDTTSFLSDLQEDIGVLTSDSESSRSDQSPSPVSEDYESEDLLLDEESSRTSSAESLSQNSCYRELAARRATESEGSGDMALHHSVAQADIVKALMANHTLLSPDFITTLRDYQRELNSRGSAWDRLRQETDLMTLTGLLWCWLEHLKDPILDRQDLTYLVLLAERPADGLAKLENEHSFTVEYLVHFVARLGVLGEERDNVLRRILASLTRQSVAVNGALVPAGPGWPKMREGTARQMLRFLHGLHSAVSGCGSGPGNEASSSARTYRGINLMVSAIARSDKLS
ncbi:PTPDC1 [Cordylochernes scorpioides]|uniref:PTPDC1 n=1 Tax=Cordylochernes scorpioides TaxID=51811 RepID=A0ABY6L6P3_9ARAC|nr:PTPDC1 [Cordylochernes scorpioides]